jgi:CxxC motif-containing protein (DUF1111 family)
MQTRSLAIVATTLLACSSANGTSGSDTQEADTSPTTTSSSRRPRPRPSAPRAFGDPLPGLTTDELALFDQGRTQFQQSEGVDEGLGPVFNESSCVACHLGPEVGGSNGRLETRFGRRGTDGGVDPLANEGGSLIQDHAIGDVGGFVFVPEVVPPDATVVAQRRTTPLFGLGLVDATPDETFHELVRK